MPTPTRRDKIVYVLLSPFVLVWTGLNFWWLATRGAIPVNEQGRLVWAASGTVFLVSLALYVLLALAALVVLGAFVRGLSRSRQS